MTIIDFHTHLDDRWFDKPLPSAGEFLAAMDKHGVRASCIFTIMGLYGDCVRHNDALEAKARTSPDRLIPFATVDPKEGKAAVAELERRLAGGLFRGVKFHPWLQAFAPSMLKETMIDLLRCAARHRAPVIVHDGSPPYSTTMQVAAMARWVPEATVVLSHAGSADYTWPAGQMIREIPNLHACFCGPRAGDLEYLVEAGGAEKVLFGSDFGAAKPEILAERIDDAMAAMMSPEDRVKVMGGNAAKMLGL